MIVFQNENFLAVDKPAGWLSVPSRMVDKDERVCLVTHLRNKLRLDILMPVHRLDVEVSGLILFAKSKKAHRAANDWFEHREIKKKYEAFSEGRPKQESYEWTSFLVRGKKRAFERADGKEAITRAEFLGSRNRDGNTLAHWLIEPLTGRSHQIRFHLSKAGFPIVGDALYGSTLPFEQNAIALRSVELNFTRCSGASEFELPRRLLAEPLK